jgi:DNA-directed RNA polymerase specialized sigma subunit
MVDPSDEKDFTDLIDNNLYKEIFREVFDSLDPISKNILEMYWQKISPREIAERLGYTYGYVRKKKCEAQTKLTEKVKNHPGYKGIMSSERIAEKVVHE